MIGGPLPLNEQQRRAAKFWAADDCLWTTQETVEFNLQTFARVVLNLRDPAPPTMADAAEMLWVVLANVSGGDWTKQTPEWQEAAARWRDYYFAAKVEADLTRHDVTPKEG
jgi:hypothetical protein